MGLYEGMVVGSGWGNLGSLGWGCDAVVFDYFPSSRGCGSNLLDLCGWTLTQKVKDERNEQGKEKKTKYWMEWKEGQLEKKARRKLKTKEKR